MRIVILGDEDREEEPIDSALPGTWQVELPIWKPISHVAAVMQLPVSAMNMRIENEGGIVHLTRAVGDNESK